MKFVEVSILGKSAQYVPIMLKFERIDVSEVKMRGGGAGGGADRKGATAVTRRGGIPTG